MFLKQKSKNLQNKIQKDAHIYVHIFMYVLEFDPIIFARHCLFLLCLQAFTALGLHVFCISLNGFVLWFGLGWWFTMRILGDC